MSWFEILAILSMLGAEDPISRAEKPRAPDLMCFLALLILFNGFLVTLLVLMFDKVPAFLSIPLGAVETPSVCRALAEATLGNFKELAALPPACKVLALGPLEEPIPLA